MRRISLPPILRPLALAAALAPLSALATQLNVTDTAVIGQTLTGGVSRTLNLSPAINGLAVGPASDATLTLVFAEGAPSTSNMTRTVTAYSPASYCCEAYLAANDYYTVGQAPSEAIVTSAGGASASGAVSSYTTTPFTYVNNTVISYDSPSGSRYSFYYVYSNYTRTVNYTGDFSVTLDLNSTDLARISSLESFSYSINPTNSPVLLADSLHVDYLSSAFAPLGMPVPTPASTGLMSVALGFLVVLGRRRTQKA